MDIHQGYKSNRTVTLYKYAHWPMKLYQYANITDISADVVNSSTNINASIILVSVMDFTNVLILKNMADIDQYQ